ncbi:MAG: ribosome silencing factor [Alphaproteobacteria bacterium]|nr:ribosome silencing factor [Alphaproteobacteria bacterium]MBE8220387.1 ribosome silencing factor [Alphaproteobacteria bacterium]
MNPDAHAEPAPDELCALICAGLDDDLAQDITQLDLAERTSIADYMVIATGRSARHVGALADHLSERLKKAGLRDIRMEGKQQGDWVLVDAGHVIVHLFRAEIRTHYDLEKLWTTPYQDQNQTAALTTDESETHL